ncbi:hypothetical protein NL676_019203 [Syzygium grande]|nr:hypothetical protein NL676_019203 [Syzygium grande]
MSALPVCSATPSSSLHSQNSLNGGLQSLNLFQKDFNHGCFSRDKIFPASLDGKSLQNMPVERRLLNSPILTLTTVSENQSGVLPQ